MDMDSARVTLQRVKRKNLVRTRGSEMLSHAQHAIALNIKGRESFLSEPNAKEDGQERGVGEDRSVAQDSSAAALQFWAIPNWQPEMDAKNSEAAELLRLSTCHQLSASFAVCFPFRPVNSLALARCVSVQRWYFALVILIAVVIIAMGPSVIFENMAVSILSSFMLIFCLFVEASRFDRSLVWHLLFRFEVLVFMFSTYSFCFWNILSPRFGKFGMTRSICNNINYICYYTLALLMDGAPM
jgi:hypothetical protein